MPLSLVEFLSRAATSSNQAATGLSQAAVSSSCGKWGVTLL